MSKRKKDNSVNGTPAASSRGPSLGRGGSKASQVVNQRNPCIQDMCRDQVKLGTWNVRTMLRPGKLINVISEMRRANINILGLSEIRWKDGGDFISDGVRVVYTGGHESKRGVAILMDEKTAKCVKEIERISDRLISVTISAQPKDLVVMQVYMPTSDYDDEDIEEMYNKIEEVMGRKKGNINLVIMGDWNAVVGEGEDHEVVGKFGLGKRNERGNKLVDFAVRNQLVITNTWFQHDKRRRYTWKKPGDTGRYQIDFILVKKRYRNGVKNA
jgi:exonuclease III